MDIDFRGELNPDQYAAVTAPAETPALVLAGAGSGKTRTLTYRVAWLLSHCEVSPRGILLLTFTNKAANQMLARISALTGYSAREFWGGTFHSVGNRILRIEGSAIGLEPNFTIMDAEDADKLMKRAAEESFAGFFSNKDNPRAGLLGDIISYSRNTMLTLTSAMAYRFNWIETPVSEIETIAQTYRSLKRSQNLCDFDDLLELWFELFKTHPEILSKYAERFKNVLVDEYQDTNKLQSSILDMLARRGNISAVGDDAQCIYSWRGAEIDNILCFRDRYPNASIFKIENNYRSTRQILDFANAILEQMDVDDEYRKRLVASGSSAELPVVAGVLDGAAQGRLVGDMILTLVRGGAYSFGDIAILYRSHYQAMDMQLQLQYARIPFVVTSGLKFFEQAHVKDVIALVRFAANQRDGVSFTRFARFLPKVGEKTANKIFDAATLYAKEKNVSVIRAFASRKVMAKVPATARDSFGEMACSLAELEDAVMALSGRGKNADTANAGAEPVQTLLFDARGTPAPDRKAGAVSAQSPKDVVKAACCGWYCGVMKTAYEDYADRADDFDALADYAARYRDMEDFLANVSLEMEAQLAVAEDGSLDRVRMMTVHQAKGLEFPVVFVIGASDGLFPLQRSIDAGDVDEECRLFYVAATRAKRKLVMVYPKVANSGGRFEMRQKSRFLEGINPSLYSDI